MSGTALLHRVHCRGEGCGRDLLGTAGDTTRTRNVLPEGPPGLQGLLLESSVFQASYAN